MTNGKIAVSAKLSSALELQWVLEPINLINQRRTRNRGNAPAKDVFCNAADLQSADISIKCVACAEIKAVADCRAGVDPVTTFERNHITWIDRSTKQSATFTTGVEALTKLLVPVLGP